MTERPGPLGVMMYEYQRATEDFSQVIREMNPSMYDAPLNLNAGDSELVSIGDIVLHVVGSAFSYACYAREAFGMEFKRWGDKPVAQADVPDVLRRMIEYTYVSLDGKWDLTGEEVEEIRTPVRWNTDYNLEILLEHAIVHILRHRRQIERLLLQSS